MTSVATASRVSSPSVALRRSCLHVPPVVALLPPGTCWCYELHGARDDRALYIGIADNLSRRLRQHKRRKPWWSEVRLIYAVPHQTRLAAMSAESYAIRCPVSRPVYNVVVPAVQVIDWDEDFLGFVEILAADV